MDYNVFDRWTIIAIIITVVICIVVAYFMGEL